jgi:hypothetical protein
MHNNFTRLLYKLGHKSLLPVFDSKVQTRTVVKCALNRGPADFPRKVPPVRGFYHTTCVKH